jgi:hypothetical protein
VSETRTRVNAAAPALLSSHVQLSNADARQLGNFGVRRQTLCRRSEAQPTKTPRLFRRDRFGLGMRRGSPPEPGECLKESAVRARSDDVQLVAPIRNRARITPNNFSTGAARLWRARGDAVPPRPEVFRQGSGKRYRTGMMLSLHRTRRRDREEGARTRAPWSDAAARPCAFHSRQPKEPSVRPACGRAPSSRKPDFGNSNTIILIPYSSRNSARFGTASSPSPQTSHN